MGMIGYLLQVSENELEEILKDSSLLAEMAFAEEESDALLDLDKSWKALFFLLTGCALADLDQAAAPFVWLIVSDGVVDEEQDMGYGPAFYITPQEVRQMHDELDRISVEEFRNRYDGPKMDAAGVYPEVWEEEDSKDYVVGYFEQVKAFYRTAAASGNAVISFISKNVVVERCVKKAPRCSRDDTRIRALMLFANCLDGMVIPYNLIGNSYTRLPVAA